MAALDVLASSSSYGEAFPNVLGEAMASGVPCAVTDVGDSAYIVGDTGRVVSSGDMEGLAHAIGSLLEMPAEALRILGARARARVAEHFEIGKIVRRYEAFYQELLPQVGISGDDRGDWIGAVNEFRKRVPWWVRIGAEQPSVFRRDLGMESCRRSSWVPIPTAFASARCWPCSSARALNAILRE